MCCACSNVKLSTTSFHSCHSSFCCFASLYQDSAFTVCSQARPKLLQYFTFLFSVNNWKTCWINNNGDYSFGTCDMNCQGRQAAESQDSRMWPVDIPAGLPAPKVSSNLHWNSATLLHTCPVYLCLSNSVYFFWISASSLGLR